MKIRPLERAAVALYVDGDASVVQEAVYDDRAVTLRAFIQDWPCEVRPIGENILDMALADLEITVHSSGKPARDSREPEVAFAQMPLDSSSVVRLSYGTEIQQIASYLKSGLSALVRCDKLVAERLGQAIADAAGLEVARIDIEVADVGGMASRAQRQIAALRQTVADLKRNQVLVLPHLDLLAGGASGLSNEARDAAEILYAARGAGRDSEALLLGFVDPSLDVPEVLAARFAVRIEALGVPKVLDVPDGTTRPLGEVLVTQEEAAHFRNYDPAALYKNVAGMNPIRLRDAIRYAVEAHKADAPVPAEKLYRSIRVFKAQTSGSFEIPNVSFNDIGGYHALKADLQDALRLMTESFDSLSEPGLQRELIPRGFLFYGPPGTGKTLFAKAIANALNAAILVVSGPEVTDMYVGESERKVRSLFAEARRNAPSVLVFDEFDAIAAKRSGRDDGGSRAGNAVVAQILTEMDGFRPDVPILVIGTTNQISLIDPALLRPSRFRAVKIDLPDDKARRAIADVHARKFGIVCTPALLDAIEAATDSFNGDEIRSIFRDACVEVHVRKRPLTAHMIGRIVGAARHAKNMLAGEEKTVVLLTRAGRPADNTPARDADGLVNIPIEDKPQDSNDHVDRPER